MNFKILRHSSVLVPTFIVSVAMNMRHVHECHVLALFDHELGIWITCGRDSGWLFGLAFYRIAADDERNNLHNSGRCWINDDV